MANAVDLMNDALDAIVDLYRAENGESPKRWEIYDIYKMAMECRLFGDDYACGDPDEPNGRMTRFRLLNRRRATREVPA